MEFQTVYKAKDAFYKPAYLDFDFKIGFFKVTKEYASCCL